MKFGNGNPENRETKCYKKREPWHIVCLFRKYRIQPWFRAGKRCKRRKIYNSNVGNVEVGVTSREHESTEINGTCTYEKDFLYFIIIISYSRSRSIIYIFFRIIIFLFIPGTRYRYLLIPGPSV